MLRNAPEPAATANKAGRFVPLAGAFVEYILAGRDRQLP